MKTAWGAERRPSQSTAGPTGAGAGFPGCSGSLVLAVLVGGTRAWCGSAIRSTRRHAGSPGGGHHRPGHIHLDHRHHPRPRRRHRQCDRLPPVREGPRGRGAPARRATTWPRHSSFDSVISALEKGPPVVSPEVHHPRGVHPGPDRGPGRQPARPQSGHSWPRPPAARSAPSTSRRGRPTSKDCCSRPPTRCRADDSDVIIVQKMVTTFDHNASSPGPQPGRRDRSA